MEKKFRAWYKGDINLNKPQKFIWDRVEGDHCDFVLENDLLENITPVIRYSADSVFCDDDWIIEQFTGRKDKKSVEIYEGDILGTKNIIYGFVYWDNDRAEYMIDTSIQSDGGIGKKDLYPNTQLNEVIGNIHENLNIIGNKYE